MTATRSSPSPNSPPLSPQLHSFIEPTIIPPRTTHTHSIILLHGRGSNGRDFGTELITTNLSSPDPNDTLPKRFPGLKFIFPSAKCSRATAFKSIHIPQWFDNMPLSVDQEPYKGLQYEGLRDSSQYIHSLIDTEAKLVGANNVILGGLSQGSAQMLHVLLSYVDDGRGALGGFVGMSGWLPFQKDLAELLPLDDRGGGLTEDRPSDVLKAKERESRFDLAIRAINFTRESVLGLFPAKRENCVSVHSTPIWLAHGTMDQVIRCKYGELAAKTLEKLGWDVTWMLYEDLEHWYAPFELEDLAIFLSARVGVPEAD